MVRKTSNLPKTDPRNDFPRIIENAFNSGDPYYFRETFRFLLESNCRLETLKTERKNTKSSTTTAQSTLYANDINASVEQTVFGCEKIADYFTGCMVSIPDAIFLVHDWKLFARQNNGCSLVMKFSYTGSNIFDTDALCIIRDRHQCHDRDPDDPDEDDDTTFDTDTGGGGMNTIQFRERSRASKYDHRKRNKRSTVGEFISRHEYQADHIPEISMAGMTIADAKGGNSGSDEKDGHHGGGKKGQHTSTQENDRKGDVFSSQHAAEHKYASSTQESMQKKNHYVDEEDAAEIHSLASSTNHSLGTSISGTSTGTFAVYTDDSTGKKRGIKGEATTMNAQGIMRFHIQSNNKVSVIQCHRIVKS